ncbi:MAG: nitrous oxide reductase accessory protein NosL [Flavisolibacter sp.]
MKKMSTTSRIIIALASLALIATYFFPVWFIYLIAPQYPEGLTMYIWLDKLSGQVEIINGLNHYIGMKHIEEQMFPEFKYLIYVIGFFILLGLATAITGSRKLLWSYCIIIILFAAAAMVDFYMWGYKYGHELDPTAPIQVPGLSYQPPVIGHKKLLNFDAFSYPDTGGWFLIISSLLFFIVLFLEWKRTRKMKSNQTIKTKSATTAIASLILAVGLFSCNPKPENINYGKDQCTECKMTIMDARFGGEIVSKKGKIFKFDDAHCMAAFMERRGEELKNIHKTLLVDYQTKDHWLNVDTAVFVLSSRLKSPMGSNAAAFSSKKEAEKKAEELEGKITDWATLYNIIH